MTRNWHLSIGWCATLALICTVIPRPANAENKGDKPIRLSTTAQFAPIGTAYSLGTFAIDGRPASGEQAIWGGELISTTGGSSVDVDIDLMGRITLKNAATARLTTVRNLDAFGEQRLLVASLLDGDMAVRLRQDAAAYIESRGSAFTSSSGAIFRIRVRDSQPLIDTFKGEVKIEPLPASPRFTPRAGKKGPGNIVVPAPETPTSVEAGKQVPVVLLVKKLIPSSGTGSLTKTFSPHLVSYSPQAPQLETPAANRRVHFEVDANVGTITPEGVTGADGGVQVTLTAGPNRTTGNLRAWVIEEPGDPADTDYVHYSRTVVVTKPGLFRLRNKLLAGAAVAAVIVIIERPGGKGAIKQQPPPVIP